MKQNLSPLQIKYQKEVVPYLQKQLGYKNKLAVPRLEKVVINAGIGRAIRDPKFLDLAINSLSRITGQKPLLRPAKKSVSAFKVRKGQIVGLKVTLRKKRMYDFLEKLIKVTLPRIRDFRGIPLKSIDKQGNLTLGIKEHIVFPETKPEEVENLFGLEVCIHTSAKNKEEGLQLFKALGFPLQKK